MLVQVLPWYQVDSSKRKNTQNENSNGIVDIDVINIVFMQKIFIEGFSTKNLSQSSDNKISLGVVYC